MTEREREKEREERETARQVHERVSVFGGQRDRERDRERDRGRENTAKMKRGREKEANVCSSPTGGRCVSTFGSDPDGLPKNRIDKTQTHSLSLSLSLSRMVCQRIEWTRPCSPHCRKRRRRRRRFY
jgi:hypothetical protein